MMMNLLVDGEVEMSDRGKTSTLNASSNGSDAAQNSLLNVQVKQDKVYNGPRDILFNENEEIKDHIKKLYRWPNQDLLLIIP